MPGERPGALPRAVSGGHAPPPSLPPGLIICLHCHASHTDPAAFITHVVGHRLPWPGSDAGPGPAVAKRACAPCGAQFASAIEHSMHRIGHAGRGGGRRRLGRPPMPALLATLSLGQDALYARRPALTGAGPVLRALPPPLPRPPRGSHPTCLASTLPAPTSLHRRRCRRRRRHLPRRHRRRWRRPQVSGCLFPRDTGFFTL